MKMTTGYEFQGYFITEYIDVIFDEILVGLGFGRSIVSGIDNFFSALTGSESTEIIDKLNKVKQELRSRVETKAKRLGANALIGIDFESSRLGELIMVSMTATAVKIEKVVSPLPLLESAQKKAEEEKQERLRVEQRQRDREYLQAHRDNLDLEGIVRVVQSCQSAKEIEDYAEELTKNYPGLLPDSLIEKIKQAVSFERIYGKGGGTKNLIDVFRELIEHEKQ